MNKHEGSTLESLLEELGELEEVKARAAENVLNIQTERGMKESGISQAHASESGHTDS